MQGAFTLDGYPNSHEVVAIDDVGSEVVGPREAARYAGTADAITVTGPVVVLRCLLKSASFSAGNVSYVYRDGMTARAEVDLRSEPMIVELLPGLKEFARNLK
jgi:hypothetical protein